MGLSPAGSCDSGTGWPCEKAGLGSPNQYPPNKGPLIEPLWS